MRRSLVTLLFLTMASVLSPSAHAANAQPANTSTQSEAYFIDILYLRDGKTADDAKIYFDKVEPVIAKHGLKRVAPGFIITNVMRGDVQPNLVNVWTVSDPAHTFDEIFKDPAYLQHVELRSATFDMKSSYMFMMAPANY